LGRRRPGAARPALSRRRRSRGAICPGLRYTSSIRIDLRDTASLRIAGRRIKTRGFLDGRPQGPEAHKWRLILLKLLSAEPDVVLVAKDTDGDDRQLAGLRQAIDLFESLGSPCVIILAAPHQDAEAWLVADGSLPLTPDELASLRDRLLGDVPRLERRGGGAGFCAFLDELRRRVVPLIVRGA
jgi:hypothetical protein